MKFKVGDTVVLDRGRYPRMMEFLDEEDTVNFGSILSISSSDQTCLIKWGCDHLQGRYPMRYVRSHAGYHEDFLDKIKDRMSYFLVLNWTF